MLPGDTPFRINSCLHVGIPNHAAGRNAVAARHTSNTVSSKGESLFPGNARGICRHQHRHHY